MSTEGLLCSHVLPTCIFTVTMLSSGARKITDDMLDSPTAWTVITENETCKVTECADKFVNLLTTITDRYSSLPQPGHR